MTIQRSWRNIMKYGLLQETEEVAPKAGADKDTGTPGTGLDTYLAVIFPCL